MNVRRASSPPYGGHTNGGAHGAVPSQCISSTIMRALVLRASSSINGIAFSYGNSLLGVISSVSNSPRTG